jgi:sugar phosphate isomerase/epimerase
MIALPPVRPLGTMITYGFVDGGLESDLEIARLLGVEVVEILPDWRNLPDAGIVRDQVANSGLVIHSAHGCWGGQSIQAPRVDLGAVEPTTWRASVDDLKQCIDWLEEAGGTCVVVHPGGLSDPEELGPRRDALARGLLALAAHARGSGIVVCVENMPAGVHPGSRMADLAALLAELDRPELALALDTGHANITTTARDETRDAGPRLRTTHVHDNDGRQDAHLPPGLGTVDWAAWLGALDAIGYRGPIILECIRHLRRNPETLTADSIARLKRLTVGSTT